MGSVSFFGWYCVTACSAAHTWLWLIKMPMMVYREIEVASNQITPVFICRQPGNHTRAAIIPKRTVKLIFSIKPELLHPFDFEASLQ